MNKRDDRSTLTTFHIGADLGRQHDFTCWCLLQKVVPLDRRNRFLTDETKYQLVGMERFPLKTSYLKIIESIVERLKYDPFDDGTQTNLAFDKGGVGVAVSDLIKADEFLDRRLNKLLPINITAGRVVAENADGINVPKFDLIMAVVLAFQRERLEFAGDLEELGALLDELQNFEMKNTAHGNQTFNAKSGAHDDMVLALALAVWSAMHGDDSEPDDELLRGALDPKSWTRGRGGRRF